MTALDRKLIIRNTTMSSRVAVYETADGIEVDSSEQYEIAHRRVLFEDVMMVTYHTEIGWPYVLANGFIAFVFLMIGGSIFGANASPMAALIFALIGTPSLILLLLRLVVKVDVVSVFGRRSKATIRFPWKRRRAREVYGRICARVRQVQAQLAASERESESEPAAPAPPMPEEPPPLPPRPVLTSL